MRPLTSRTLGWITGLDYWAGLPGWITGLDYWAGLLGRPIKPGRAREEQSPDEAHRRPLCLPAALSCGSSDCCVGQGDDIERAPPRKQEACTAVAIVVHDRPAVA